MQMCNPDNLGMHAHTAIQTCSRKYPRSALMSVTIIIIIDPEHLPSILDLLDTQLREGVGVISQVEGVKGSTWVQIIQALHSWALTVCTVSLGQTQQQDLQAYVLRHNKLYQTLGDNLYLYSFVPASIRMQPLAVNAADSDQRQCHLVQLVDSKLETHQMYWWVSGLGEKKGGGGRPRGVNFSLAIDGKS